MTGKYATGGNAPSPIQEPQALTRLRGSSGADEVDRWADDYKALITENARLREFLLAIAGDYHEVVVHGGDFKTCTRPRCSDVRAALAASKWAHESATVRAYDSVEQETP